MDKITVVCHKDHDKGYEDYVGKCLLCEVERLRKREWVGLTDEEVSYCRYAATFCDELDTAYMAELIEKDLKEKNT